MPSAKRAVFGLAACVVAVTMSTSLATRALAGSGAAPQQPAAQNAAARQVVGTIKAIRGNMITLAPDTGAEVNVQVRATLRILRVAPGETEEMPPPSNFRISKWATGFWCEARLAATPSPWWLPASSP